MKLFPFIFLFLAFYVIKAQETNSDYLFEKDGYLICYKKSGEIFSGIMAGKSKDDNFTYKKTIVNGLEEGHAWFYENKNILVSEGEYSQGIENGKWIWYYSNGQIKAEGYYENGVGSGMWKYWDESGHIEREGEIENGKEKGKWLYYNDFGNVSTTRIYQAGLKNGLEIWYYNDGQKMIERTFEYGIENGKFAGWFKNGQRKFEGSSVNGKIVRYIEWDLSGKAIKIQNNELEDKNL